MQQTEQKTVVLSKSYQAKREFQNDSKTCQLHLTEIFCPNTPKFIHFVGKVFKKPIEWRKRN